METVGLISLAWESVLKVVALTGLLSAALTAFAAWLIVRLTRPLDSYAEELAKQLARHQNLDRLVEETRRVTDAAEKIKSELSHENWDRQTRWAAKRDLYVRIAEALGEYRNVCVTSKGLEYLRMTRNLSDPKYGPSLERRREDTLRQMDGALVKWHNAVDAAPLMIPDEAYGPLREFQPRLIRYGTPYWEEDFEHNIAVTQWALYQFQLAARTDLGFEPMAWKPTILTAALSEEESGVSAQKARA
jgi:hypothetical protein